MKNNAFACAVLLSLLGFCSGTQESKAPGTNERTNQGGVNHQIIELEGELRNANLNSDVSFFEQVMAEDFVGISSRGYVYNKAGNIRACRSGRLRFESIVYSNQSVRVYGDTAIVNGNVNIKGSFGAHPLDGTYAYTRVYVRVRGSWKIVNFQATIVRPRPERSFVTTQDRLVNPPKSSVRTKSPQFGPGTGVSEG